MLWRWFISPNEKNTLKTAKKENESTVVVILGSVADEKMDLKMDSVDQQGKTYFPFFICNF